VTVTGTLKDSAGKALAGVLLELQTATGAGAVSAVSDRMGTFRFDSVPAGTYTLASTTVIFGDPDRVVTVPAAGPVTLALVATLSAKLATVQVVARRLNQARQNLAPDIGADVYHFDRQDILDLPGGDATPLNQVLLQATGVTQDSYGQLHVRGDHANLSTG
jgi:threonine dehydrogenase-like Zn-dependent dehydrogenase